MSSFLEGDRSVRNQPDFLFHLLPKICRADYSKICRLFPVPPSSRRGRSFDDANSDRGPGGILLIALQFANREDHRLRIKVEVDSLADG